MAVRAAETAGEAAGRVRVATRVGAPALPSLRLDGLRKTFRGRVALDGLSLSVGDGEVLCLLGPTGAGKSTTFQLLAGLLRPDAGRVYLEGRQVGLEDPALRSRMGVVFQRGSLDDHLTARENLRLGARLYAVPPAQTKARVEEMLAWMGFSDSADEKVAGWSGGMRRRLELARVLVHGPRILLLDEPTQGLDEASFRAFWKHLGQLRAAGGLTVLLTSRRAEEAALCNRVALLDGGRLLACDTPEALVSRVRGDILTVEASAPEEVAVGLSEVLGLRAEVVDGRVVVEAEAGHTLIPRIVEAFPAGRLAGVALRRPTLADVFLELTGRALGADRPAEPPAPKRRR